jgi:uncharacterized DUF497 family protein
VLQFRSYGAEDVRVRVRIDELLWDDWNEDHIAMHGIDPAEVEDVVFDASSRVLRTRGAEQRRYVVLGLTQAGRYLLVVLELMGKARAYPVTARDMTDDEKHRFKRRR